MHRRQRGGVRSRADLGLAGSTFGRGWDIGGPGGQHHIHHRCGHDSSYSDDNGGGDSDNGCREPAADGRVPDVDLPAVPGGDGGFVAGDSHRFAGRGARPAFFPEGAYLQLKTIIDPASDYTNRLLAEFAADLVAAHALLGQKAGTASLVAVNVPEQYGHWIPPGVCDNGVGYYEVANSRVVYQEDGAVRSFGIASLISWRGGWYIVHLGAILRSTSQGIVEDPEIGPGSSPDSTTC